MNTDDMTIGEVKKLSSLFCPAPKTPVIHPMTGKYVIVRCKDAGVHSGVLASAENRHCILTDSRRLWYWKPANSACFLSGVAVEGVHGSSKLGAPVTICLTENCEIIECTPKAETSLREAKTYEA